MFCPDQQFQIVIAESAKVFNILAMLLNIAEFACYIAIFWDQARKIFNWWKKGLLLAKSFIFSTNTTRPRPRTRPSETCKSWFTAGSVK